MRLAFFGTADFAVPALERLASSVLLVVAQPDRPSGRGMAMRASPVKTRAVELSLPVETPEKCRAPEFVDRIKALDLDALVVAAYGQILPASLLESTRRGAINLHGSILPKYRGAAPIQRCIQNGDTKTGVTMIQMDKGMDTGDIVATVETSIGADETAGELFDRLARLAGDMAAEWMPRVCAGDYERVPQNASLATMAPKVEKSEAELRFSGPALREYNRFRAFTPFPGAFLQTRIGHVRVSRASLDLATNPGVGVVAAVRPMLSIGFDGGSISFIEVLPEGKKRMSGSDFANGAHLSVGDCLTA